MLRCIARNERCGYELCSVLRHLTSLSCLALNEMVIMMDWEGGADYLFCLLYRQGDPVFYSPRNWAPYCSTERRTVLSTGCRALQINWVCNCSQPLSPQIIWSTKCWVKRMHRIMPRGVAHTRQDIVKMHLSLWTDLVQNNGFCSGGYEPLDFIATRNFLVTWISIGHWIVES